MKNTSGQKFHPIEPSFENGTAMEWIVHLDFVSDDHQNGYQKTHYAHDCSRDEAIGQAILAHLNEQLPIKSITVYQCVFIK